MATVISKAQFQSMVESNVKGTTAITIDCITTPNMRKTGNPYLGVKKFQTMNGLIGFIYEDGVNRLAAKEGKEEREAKARSWGEIGDGRFFVHNGDKTYLRMMVKGSTNVYYFMPDGTEVSKAELAPFLPVKKKSSTQADLEGELIERDINVDNIKAVRMMGEEYIMVSMEVAPESEKVQELVEA